MLERKRRSLQKKISDAKAFRKKLEIYREEPDAIEELICEAIPHFREIFDPTLRAEMPQCPEIGPLLSGWEKIEKPVAIPPAAHESGLFLLPYTDEFRADFVARLRQRLRPLASLMKLLRSLEQRYQDAEKLPEPEKKEGAEVAKKENPYQSDYHFFKLLISLTPDNNHLGALLSEIGEIASAESAPPGQILFALEAGKDRLSPSLRESLLQYDRMKLLCENIYLCSIASWATLSNYVSMQVKAIEKEMLEGTGAPVYRPAFIEFQRLLASLTASLNGAPTLMQTKALFYASLALREFIAKESHPKDPFRLSNFSQVGAGKTYTTPIFLRLFAHLLGEKESRDPNLIILYFTEANLCQNVLESMIDIGISKAAVHIGHLKSLPTLPLKSGDCVILSRHEFGLKKREEIIYPLEILIRRGLSFVIVADESSFLKNSESGIALAMEYLYSHLKKRHALRVDYRLSATPVNNDTGDFIYLLRTNTINIASFLKAYPDIARQMRSLLRDVIQRIPGLPDFSLDRLLTLLKKSGSLTGVLLFQEIVEEEKEQESPQKDESDRCRALYYTDCAGAVLGLYYYAVYLLELFPIRLDVEEKGKEREVTFVDILQHLGIGYQRITQAVKEPVEILHGLERPITHPGSRQLGALIPCLLLAKEMTSALTYDRALNADEDIQFQINAKQLKPSLIESVTHLEVLEKIRQFLNLIMFANLVRKVRASQTGWRLLRSDIEQEFLRLRLEFCVTYAAARGLPVIHKEETVTRKVHQGFRITEKTEHYPYPAVDSKEKALLLEFLSGDTTAGLLGARLIDDLAQYLAPVRFFELTDLLERPTNERTLRERDQLREEIEKKRNGILEILIGALGLSTRLEKGIDLTRVLKEDIEKHPPEEDGLLHFRPSILFRYPTFLEEVHHTLSGAIAHRSEYEKRELSRLISDIGSARIDLTTGLAEYAVIFKMSESLNLPLVLRFSGSVLHRLASIFGQKKMNLRMEPEDNERIRRLIAHAASFENFARHLSALTRRYEAPLLIGCHYRSSQQSLISATGAAHAINGEIPKEERYRILGAFDALGEKMGKTLIATTQSILKGFNIFHAQYGCMTEGMNNAEVRVQMAGRLRPLYPQHLEEIDHWIRILESENPEAPVLLHLKRLQKQVKIFDVIAPEMLGGFPDIQSGKALMLNTFLFQQIHQRSFPALFDDRAVLHYLDHRPRFNGKTVEQFCTKAVEESLSWYLGKLQGREEITLTELIALMEEEIRLRAEENVRVSSYYPILEGSRMTA